jgi:hypothetical protein
MACKSQHQSIKKIQERSMTSLPVKSQATPGISVLSLLAPYFDRYFTLERVHPSDTYNYKARNFYEIPVIDVTMHTPKCRTGSWMYVAISGDAKLPTLDPGDKLYVGSQTKADRMFRGDGMGGENFHHAQMRAGNGNDNPVNHLRSGNKVDVYRISANSIAAAVREVTALSRLAPLLVQSTNHVGYWFEQFILSAEGQSWRWNTAAADARAQRVVRCL